MNERAPQPFDSSWEESIHLLDELPAMPLEERIEAIERLVRNPSPGIRSRALRMGAAVIPDERIKEYLRSDADDVLRNAGVEMLKMRGNRGFGLAIAVLKDEDSDVVLQAVIVLNHLRDPRALEPLRSTLHHPDPNIVQETIMAIGQLGDARAIPDLLGFLEVDPWLQMAAVQALGSLRSPVAVPHLKNLLTDFMAGPLAAEALARIGGSNAFKALAQHWLRFGDEVDTETTLGLLAHVLEGLPRAPAPVEGLRPELARRLTDEASSDTVRLAAARALIALGPGGEDRPALTLLATSHSEASVLPTCLHHRRDLIGQLLATSGIQRTWGFLLAARYPRTAPQEAIVAALRGTPDAEQLGPMIRALKKIRSLEVGEALLGLYLRLPGEQRAALHPILQLHRASLKRLLDGDGHGAGVEAERTTRVVLSVLLGSSPQEVAAELARLSDEEGAQVVTELLDHDDVLRMLPWQRWLEQRPDVYGEVGAEFAARVGLHELAPTFRRLLAQQPEPYLIRALGELGDRDAVPLLVDLLGDVGNPLEPIVLESLGRIGGPESRAALRDATRSGHPPRERMAYRALARCATGEDDELFRDAIAHGDWYVRLSCAEVLGRFSRPENLAPLAQLAADPVPIVAQRALSFLEA